MTEQHRANGEYDQIFEGNNPNFDKYTDVQVKINPTAEEIENEIIGFMDDDEDIQPKDTTEVGEHHIDHIQTSWSLVKELGSEKVGVTLMRNLFSMSPQLL